MHFLLIDYIYSLQSHHLFNLDGRSNMIKKRRNIKFEIKDKKRG